MRVVTDADVVDAVLEAVSAVVIGFEDEWRAPAAAMVEASGPSVVLLTRMLASELRTDGYEASLRRLADLAARVRTGRLEEPLA